MLRPVGFFSDLAFGWAWATCRLGDAAGSRQFSTADLECILRYLNGGRPFLDVMLPVEDPLDPARPIVASGLIRTDGEWAWPDALAFFVERHDVGIPNEFVEHARATGFNVELTDGAQQFTLPGLVFEDE